MIMNPKVRAARQLLKAVDKAHGDREDQEMRGAARLLLRLTEPGGCVGNGSWLYSWWGSGWNVTLSHMAMVDPQAGLREHDFPEDLYDPTERTVDGRRILSW